jgi:hypothetical protein
MVQTWRKVIRPAATYFSHLDTPRIKHYTRIEA